MEQKTFINSDRYYRESRKIKIMKSANDVKASHNFDIKYTGGYSLDGTTIFLVNNLVRGAAGASILNAEIVSKMSLK